jgi:hypothetical protein
MLTSLDRLFRLKNEKKLIHSMKITEQYVQYITSQPNSNK